MTIKPLETTHFELTEHDGSPAGFLSACLLPGDEESAGGIHLGLRVDFGHEGYLSREKARALAAWLLEAAGEEP